MERSLIAVDRNHTLTTVAAQQDSRTRKPPTAMAGSECVWDIFIMQLTKDDACPMEAFGVVNHKLNIII